MMKFVCKLTEQYNIPTTVSMNPVMIDGTGMCGGCRVIVGGETKFACVDGPDFDGHKIDWDTAMKRGRMFKGYEEKFMQRRSLQNRQNQSSRLIKGGFLICQI